MIFKSKQERQKTKIEKRVEKLPTAELISWSDQIMYSVGRNLAAWQRSSHPATLEEARVGAEALHVILETISERAVK